jgi:hypothetical protein
MLRHNGRGKEWEIWMDEDVVSVDSERDLGELTNPDHNGMLAVSL